MGRMVVGGRLYIRSRSLDGRGVDFRTSFLGDEE